MAVVTKVYTPANVLQGPADLYLDIAPPASSATPTADSNELTLDASGQPTDNGLAAPAAPTLSQVAAAGAPSGALFVKVTLVNEFGETLASAESTLTVTAGNALQVAAPSPVWNATGWNVYISTTSGTETKQNGATPVSLGQPWTQTQALVSGAALPASNTSAGGIHIGSIEAPSQVQITEKFNEIRDDQHESAIDLAFDTIEAEIDVVIKEVALANVQRYFTSKKLSTRTLLASQDVLQAGGQFDSSMNLRSLLLVQPRRDAAGKFTYAMAYKAYLKSALQLTFHRNKENVFKLKFGCVMDPLRVAGDEVLQIVRTK